MGWHADWHRRHSDSLGRTFAVEVRAVHLLAEL
jgi:hypothetical protein